MHAEKRVLLAVAAILVSGCAGGLPTCPRKGGTAWRAVTTVHFEVLTDLDSASARASAQDFEYLRAAVAETLAPGWPGPAGRIRVILLATDHGDTFHKLYPADVRGYFTTYLRQPLIVMPTYGRRFDPSVILHDLTHYVLDGFIPVDRQPRWVAEGVASYTESVEADRDAGRVTIGKEPADRARFAKLKYLPPRTGGRASDESADDLFNGESWVKVHYLVENHRRELGQFLAGLRSGQAEPEAWAAAFPSMTRQDLDGKMTAYIRDGRHPVVTLRLPFRPDEVQERALSDAEFHVWRAALYRKRFRAPNESDPADNSRARAEIADALQQDPTLPDALATRVDLGDPVGLDELRRATVAHPEHWIGWYLFANALRQANQPTTADQAMKEARRLAEWNPAVRLDDSAPRRHGS
jgi:hypothetical protein